jgi:hypothetical protein
VYKSNQVCYDLLYVGGFFTCESGNSEYLLVSVFAFDE